MQELTAAQKRAVAADWLATLVEEVKRLVADGMTPEAAATLVERQAALALASSR